MNKFYTSPYDKNKEFDQKIYDTLSYDDKKLAIKKYEFNELFIILALLGGTSLAYSTIKVDKEAGANLKNTNWN